MFETNWITAAPAAFVLTLAFIYLLTPLAIRVGLVDRPCTRKRHHGEVPLIGGIAIFLGIVATWLASSEVTGDDVSLLTAGALLLLLGIADDYHNLTAKRRLVGQSVAALVVIFGSDIVLSDLGDILMTGSASLGVFAIPVTVFCFVGVINAMNMVDGLDGLAGGLSLVTLSALIYLSVAAGTDHLQILLLSAGAIAGFLVLNARSPFAARAKIFMGDAGSMFLGCTIAAMLIDMSQGSSRAMSPATALWVFAIPLMDTVSLIIRRTSKGRSPFSPGRDHIHHILLRSGLSVGHTVAVLVAASATLALIGIAGQMWGIPEGVMFLGFLGLFTIYQWMVARGWRIIRLNRHRRAHRLKAAAAPVKVVPPSNLVFLDQVRATAAKPQPTPAPMPAAATEKVVAEVTK